MIWVLLSILSGFGDATLFALMKKIKNINNSLIVWVQFSFALPFLFALSYLNYPQKINSNVYWIAIINGLLLMFTFYLLYKATQISDLSISMPMLSLTPLFLIFTSYFMVNEVPDFYGFIGIFLIVLGGYAIHIKDYKGGIFEPFKSLFRDKGSFYVIVVAFIWSITANLFKIGLLYSNPIFYVFIVYLFMSLIMLPLIFINFKEKAQEIKINFNMLMLLGLASAFIVATSAYAMLTAIVSYVISLKRSSVIFSIFYGYFMFKEKNIKPALIGAFIMLIGGVLITLF